jgi:hypothetical protein
MPKRIIGIAIPVRYVVLGDTRLIPNQHGGTSDDGQHRVGHVSSDRRDDRGGREGSEHLGQERKPGDERAVAAYALQVLGHEEGEAQQRGVEQEAGGVGAGALAAGEQAQRHHRLPRAAR